MLLFFSFLSFPVPRASPPTASPGRPCARTPLSLAARPRGCLNARRKSGKGKARTEKKGRGGSREAVGGLRPWSPALAARVLLAQDPPGCQAAEQRRAPTRTRSFVAEKHKGEGKTRLPP